MSYLGWVMAMTGRFYYPKPIKNRKKVLMEFNLREMDLAV